MPTRSVGAKEEKRRVAALRTHVVSSTSMSMSSKTTATKRWGKAAMAVAESSGGLVPGAAGGVVDATLCDSGVSVLKVEMAWDLRLSESWKSSFLRLVTTLPLLSRTTTRTRTKFTRTRKVGGVSRAETSAESLAGACGAAAGVVDVAGGSLLEGACWARRWQAPNNSASKAAKQRPERRRARGNDNGFRILRFLTASRCFLAGGHTARTLDTNG